MASETLWVVQWRETDTSEWITAGGCVGLCCVQAIRRWSGDSDLRWREWPWWLKRKLVRCVPCEIVIKEPAASRAKGGKRGN